MCEEGQNFYFGSSGCESLVLWLMVVSSHIAVAAKQLVSLKVRRPKEELSTFEINQLYSSAVKSSAGHRPVSRSSR